MPQTTRVLLFLPLEIKWLVLLNRITFYSSVQLLSHVWLFATPWIATRQASLSITKSWSSLRLTSIESVMPSSISSLVVPFSSCPQSLPASESFPMSQLFAWGGRSTGVSTSASFPPEKSQGLSPSEWTGWISLQSKELSRVFSNTTVQKHQFFGAQLSSQSNSHIHQVSDAIQPSHPWSSPSPPAPNSSQHQSLFQWVNSLHEVAKVLEFQL